MTPRTVLEACQQLANVCTSGVAPSIGAIAFAAGKGWLDTHQELRDLETAGLVELVPPAKEDGFMLRYRPTTPTAGETRIEDRHET